MPAPDQAKHKDAVPDAGGSKVRNRKKNKKATTSVVDGDQIVAERGAGLSPKNASNGVPQKLNQTPVVPDRGLGAKAKKGGSKDAQSQQQAVTTKSGGGKRKGGGGAAGGDAKLGSTSSQLAVQGVSSTTKDDVLGLVRGVWILIGIGLLIYSGYVFAWYIRTLHENNMWFSHITDVEREISMRTECGLYYSYYKQIIHSKKPTFLEAVFDLTVDNATEHGHTINILSRFNVYQEVTIAWLYNWAKSINHDVQPILFYINAVFKLNGMYLSCLFALAWYLTGMWPSGLLAALQFATNLDDTTRVFFTINLREHFGFPFFWAQVLVICLFLDRNRSPASGKICLVGILVTTFLFGLSWQFNQFLLLLQCVSLYVMGVLQLAPQVKIRKVMIAIEFAMIAVGLAQFFQPMIFGSMVLSFIPAAVIMLHFWRNVPLAGGILDGSFRIFCQVFLTVVVMVLLNLTIKAFIPVEADAHIFKFLKGKFGFGNPLDFESRLYLCHGAFVFLDNDFFFRTSKTLLFPTYFITMLTFLFLIGKNLLLEWCTATVPPEILGHARPAPVSDISDKPYLLNKRPALSYLTLQSVFSGILALMTLRMKYFWTPHMVVLGTVLTGDYELWHNILAIKPKIRKPAVINGIRYTLTLGLIGFLIWRQAPIVGQQLNDLREFWDPDTVELMKWINANTAPEASFAGSMQLLAGVKACTGRHLTNHPHFEDKWLRDRTKLVYQIYGRRKPEDVYRILREVDAHYFILEDSICLARSDNCRTPDLVDLDNKVIPDNEYVTHGLTKSDVPRFCEEIRYGDEAFTKFFKLVLENRTFRVYKVLVPVNR